jgi:hypothetical protein
MKRIGIIASHIAKDNLALYNFYVFLFAGLFSLIIFFLSMFSLVAGLSLMMYATKGVVVIAPETGFQKLLWTSLIVLVVVVGVINLVAVLMNIKVRK